MAVALYSGGGAALLGSRARWRRGLHEVHYSWAGPSVAQLPEAKASCQVPSWSRTLQLQARGLQGVDRPGRPLGKMEFL